MTQGNAQREAPQKTEEIRVGDLVALTPQALRRAPRLMGPMKFYSIGAPNVFQVVGVFEDRGIKHLVIGECCSYLLLTRKANTLLCGGHDARWFQKIKLEEEAPEPQKESSPPPPPRERKKGDRLLSIELPYLGEFAAMEYLEDEQNPQFIIRGVGQRMALNGKAAVQFAKFVQSQGLM